MSQPTPVQVACSKCSHPQNFTMWRSLNVTLDPEQKDKLLSGELFLHKCGKCGVMTRVVYPMLYHDMDRDMMVWMAPEQPPDMSEAEIALLPKPLQDKCRGSIQQRKRWVTTIDRLQEKIRIADEGLDDRAIEMYKTVLRGGMKDEIDPSAEIYFAGTYSSEQGEKSLEFAVKTKLGVESVGLPYDGFEEFAKKSADYLDQIFHSSNSWVQVDESVVANSLADDSAEDSRVASRTGGILTRIFSLFRRGR